MQGWIGLDGAVALDVLEQNARLLDTYRADRHRVTQDANIERSITEGAYARRQLFELIQNAADAMRDTPGKCHVLLTKTHMFVANTGAPLTSLGVQTLMATHLSTKRDDQIGRFGLGFKSVLAVSDSPMIVSRSGSIVFDRTWSQQQIATVVNGVESYPVARMARPVDPAHLASEIPELKPLMSWATTVVVLPLKSAPSVLADSVRRFPAEFLLFSAQVRSLRLVDQTNATTERRIELQRDGEELLLADGDRRSRWVVSGTKHSPSKAALIDGGYQAARDLVTLKWAAPIEGGGRGVGRFWAFFPTSDDTTLSGIVNAPWKLADDRESLLPGQFNEELLTEVLPGLVAKTLPRLHTPEQPATVIDALPARGKESRSHADDVINLPIVEAVAEGRCIPTLDGGLSRPKGLRMHPEGLVADELELWESACSDPGRWVSHAINSSERRSKVNRLAAVSSDASRLRTVDVVDWIEHLVEKPTVLNSAVAVRLVARMIERRSELRHTLTRARVMLLDDGSLHSCQRASVFLPGGSAGAGHLLIDSALASDPAVADALELLGIKILDDVGALRSELSSRQVNWQNVWVSSRKLPIDEAEAVFREILRDQLLEKIEVQAADGLWKQPNMVFLPGPIVPADMSRDRPSTVHPVFHKQDTTLLRKLGLVEAPTLRLDPPIEGWRRVAYSQLRDLYRGKERKPRLPDESIEIVTRSIAWPLDPLQALSPAGRAALTEHLLSDLDPASNWRISLRAGGTSQKTLDWTWRHLRRHGYLSTNVGIQPVTRCLAFEEDGDYAVVDGIDQPLPIVSARVSPSQAEALGLKTNPGDLSSEDWKQLVEQAAEWPMSRRSLLYAWAALCGAEPPSRIRAACGPTAQRDFQPHEVAVATNSEMFESLTQTECPTLRVENPDDVQNLIEHWGLSDGADMLNETVDYDPAGELELLVDRYPPLRHTLDGDALRIHVQPCSRLALLVSTPTGEQSRTLSCKLQDGTLLTTAVDDATVLSQLGEALGIPLEPAIVLQRMERQRRNALREEISAAPEIEQKLLLAIGVDTLRNSVPTAALHGSGPDLSDVGIARLALAVHGYSILIDHTRALESRGLEPPTLWAGTRSARDWTRHLGFPVEFAGFTGASLDPEMEVQGPPVLGELHDYQQEIAARIRGLLDPRSEQRRGLVPLPTGAGKTRVAVQALTEYLSECHDDVDIVWVAETEELCEQAVRTWSEVWRAKGAPGASLTISRLWGKNNPVDHTGLQVVVATISKLQAIVDRPKGWTSEYGWLGGAALIVVDEAHRSIAPQYTRVLSALGGTNRVADMTTPLLGLTATPFRGYNHEETKRLADRYDSNRLDTGVFPDDDAYGFLQRRGVLARVSHTRLAGSVVTLTDDELEHVSKLRSFPESVGHRLGEDTDRNAAIVNSIRGLPADSSVLLFATSVENARVLAALLTFHGIEARAIAGQTTPAARRRYIEEFREGKIRVLTNYSVFAEGFDAPKVDAVYVTRPTFSPNVYQQMIGRGLRGPLNGGKEEVLVVNVDDNITNYGEEYAFTHFEHLWNRN